MDRQRGKNMQTSFTHTHKPSLTTSSSGQRTPAAGTRAALTYPVSCAPTPPPHTPSSPTPPSHATNPPTTPHTLHLLPRPARQPTCPARRRHTRRRHMRRRHMRRRHAARIHARAAVLRARDAEASRRRSSHTKPCATVLSM